MRKFRVYILTNYSYSLRNNQVGGIARGCIAIFSPTDEYPHILSCNEHTLAFINSILLKIDTLFSYAYQFHCKGYINIDF